MLTISWNPFEAIAITPTATTTDNGSNTVVPRIEMSFFRKKDFGENGGVARCID